MKAWLKECLRNHVVCRKTISGLRINDEGSTPLPTRVLDLGTPDSPCLRIFASGGCRASYVALSYCWGIELEARPLKAMKSNLEALSGNIDATALPLTIRQAVDVTRSLGIRYLWVDSLCILQDDEDDWRKESQKMGQIYQNATFTIAATAARHCNEGLFAKHPFVTEDFVSIPFKSGNDSLQGLYISPLPSEWHLVDFDDEINRSRWSTRAWVSAAPTIHTCQSDHHLK